VSVVVVVFSAGGLHDLVNTSFDPLEWASLDSMLQIVEAQWNKLFDVIRIKKVATNFIRRSLFRILIFVQEMRQGVLLPMLKAPVMDIVPGTFGMPGDLPGTKDRCGSLETGALIGPIGFRLAQPPNLCNTA